MPAPTFAGVSYGVIDEVTAIPQLVKLGLEVANDKEKAKALWESVKNINFETVKQLVTDKIDKYNFSDKPYLGYHELGKDGVALASIFYGGFAVKGKKLSEAVEESGETIKKTIQKKADDLDNFIKTPEFENLMNSAWEKYAKKKGFEDINAVPKEVKDLWEQRYKTLYKNREIGKITETKFQELMGGEPKTFTFQGETRKVDNLIGTTAKEIKSGKLKGSEFIDNQLKKDLMMLDLDEVPVNKIEWHLFDGADGNMIQKLETIRNIYGKEKFDFIIY